MESQSINHCMCLWNACWSYHMAIQTQKVVFLSVNILLVWINVFCQRLFGKHWRFSECTNNKKLIKSCENDQKKYQSYLDQKEIKMQRGATEEKAKAKELVVQKQAQNKKKSRSLSEKLVLISQGFLLLKKPLPKGMISSGIFCSSPIAKL